MPMSFEFNINAKDRAAGRFIGAVRKALLKAALEEKQRSGVTQQAMAAKLGVNRSVINRLLRGEANLTLRTIGEIAWALGRKPRFKLAEDFAPVGANAVRAVSTFSTTDGALIFNSETQHGAANSHIAADCRKVTVVAAST